MTPVLILIRVGQSSYKEANEARTIPIHLVPLLRTDSDAEIGPIFGLRTYSFLGSVLDSMRKRLASDPELSDRYRSIVKAISNVHQET